MIFFTERKRSTKIHMEAQNTIPRKSNLEQREWSWSNYHTQISRCITNYSNKNSIVLTPKQTYRSIKHKLEYLNMSALIYSQMIFDKDAKNIYCRKDSICNNKWCWEYLMSTCRGTKLDQFLLHKNELQVVKKKPSV